jgi:colicin import membrane protein
VKLSTSEPGVIVSGIAHVALLAATLIAFSETKNFEDAQETVPVEIVTDQQFNQITKGEKTAKETLPKPAVQVQKQADVPEPKPRPAEVEAKTDVPTPPPPLKRIPDPGQDEQPQPPAPTPPQRVADLPPPTPTPPVPTPPVRPVTPPMPEARPTPTPPPEAEAIEPPKPQPKPEKAEVTPPMPKVRPAPKEDPKPALDRTAIAKLLEKSTDNPRPASRPKSGDEASDQKPRMNTSEISRLLSKEPPGQKASAGRELSQTASIGSPTASAARMSPSMWGQLDGMMQEQYKQCWSYLGLGGEHRYVPQIKVEFQNDGSLSAQPALLNPPSDPALRSLAESAMRAVRRCNPLKIPAQFAPYYDQWKGRILRFDPEEMQG